MKPLTDIFPRASAAAPARSAELSSSAAARIARQIAETTGVVTIFGQHVAAPLMGEAR